MTEYFLPDEPRPSRWTAVAVNPMWPLLSFMLGGSWVAFPWFVVNGIALGSPDRRREIGLVLLALAGSVAIMLALYAAVGADQISKLGIRFSLLALTLWKLTAAYVLYAKQARVYGLYEYYGGRAANGMFAVIVAFVVSPKLQAALPAFWRLVLQ